VPAAQTTASRFSAPWARPPTPRCLFVSVCAEQTRLSQIDAVFSLSPVS
jgi:hypothetical protein